MTPGAEADVMRTLGEGGGGQAPACCRHLLIVQESCGGGTCEEEEGGRPEKLQPLTGVTPSLPENAVTAARQLSKHTQECGCVYKKTQKEQKKANSCLRTLWTFRSYNLFRRRPRGEERFTSANLARFTFTSVLPGKTSIKMQERTNADICARERTITSWGPLHWNSNLNFTKIYCLHLWGFCKLCDRFFCKLCYSCVKVCVSCNSCLSSVRLLCDSNVTAVFWLCGCWVTVV